VVAGNDFGVEAGGAGFAGDQYFLNLAHGGVLKFKSFFSYRMRAHRMRYIWPEIKR
jgi:hypothetical protein